MSHQYCLLHRHHKFPFNKLLVETVERRRQGHLTPEPRTMAPRTKGRGKEGMDTNPIIGCWLV